MPDPMMTLAVLQYSGMVKKASENAQDPIAKEELEVYSDALKILASDWHCIQTHYYNFIAKEQGTGEIIDLEEDRKVIEDFISDSSNGFPSNL